VLEAVYSNFQRLLFVHSKFHIELLFDQLCSLIQDNLHRLQSCIFLSHYVSATISVENINWEQDNNVAHFECKQKKIIMYGLINMGYVSLNKIRKPYNPSYKSAECDPHIESVRILLDSICSYDLFIYTLK